MRSSTAAAKVDPVLPRFDFERNAAIPIILTTVNGTTEIAREAEFFGVNSLVHKPKPLAEAAKLAYRLLEIPPQTA